MDSIPGLVMLEIRPGEFDDLLQDSFAVQAGLVQAFFPGPMLNKGIRQADIESVSYTHLRAHET